MSWLLLISLLTPTAEATWSIVAIDRNSNLIGGTGTSCVGTLDVRIIFGVAPQLGAVHAQAYLHEPGRDQAVEFLEQGLPPDEIISAITDTSFDSQSSLRQYGIVDSQGRSSGFTGTSNGIWAGDTQGTINNIVYSVQGNILTGEPVVQRTAHRFESQESCDFTENLWESLKAGGTDSEGDSRCTTNGIPSDSAFIRVVNSDGSDLINLSVVGDSQENPMDRLQILFDEWRQTNPCPQIEDANQQKEQEPDSGCQVDSGLQTSGWILGLTGLLLIRRFQ